MTSEEGMRYRQLRDNPNLVQQLEDEAIRALREKYTLEEIEKIKENIQAMVAPITRNQMQKWFDS